jgi:plastocyanin
MSNFVSSRFLFFCSVTLTILLSAHRGMAVTNTVQIFEQSATAWLFIPSNSVINAGDSITWTNRGPSSSHDATPTLAPPLWTSGLFAPGKTFTFRFTNAGVYPYRCNTHSLTHPEQRGNINVASVNVPPSVSLTNPVNGTHFFAPATFTLGARASDSDGTVANVQFFNGVNLLGSDASNPYSLTISNAAVGTYQLTAQAVDNASARATSSVVTVVVDAVPAVILENFQRPATNQFAFRIRGGNAFERCDILASDSLNNDWQTISSATFPNTFCPICPFIDFVDTNAVPANRFYKVQVFP